MKGYCSACRKTVTVHECDGKLYHDHHGVSAWFDVSTPFLAFTNERAFRVAHPLVSYYDLIELPSHGHIPVPMAVRVVGADNILRIPIDRQRKRGNDFFYCPKCEIISIVNPSVHASSFYRCKDHSNKNNADYNAQKEAELKSTVESGSFRKMRYIISARERNQCQS